MTLITFQDGKPVMRDGKVGTEQECCCGGECDCSSCLDGTVDVDIAGVTLTVTITFENDWSPFTQICFEGVGNGLSQNARQVRAYAFCHEDGKLRLVAEHSWQATGYCAQIKTFSYRFDQCDSSGCPVGEATLVATADTGEVDDIFGTCADPVVNRSCKGDLGSPSSVTFNPLP